MRYSPSRAGLTPIDRRRFLLLGGGVAAALALHSTAHASAALVDPLSGAIPLAFPLTVGAFQTPIADNWHEAREGMRYPWGHHAGSLRAHDGVDIYPVDGTPLPLVYAPFDGVVSATCLRASNDASASINYRVSSASPPPWDYSAATDTADGLPLYGNFVWITSSEAQSAGYAVLYAHLQNEPLLAALRPGQRVDAQTAIGVMGDTGNAAGTPQLHVELHYPAGASALCRDCTPRHAVTSFDPFASLRTAIARG
jgi:murein DD-endopeptidase MepM/ murein hydrolase activator NlpD